VTVAITTYDFDTGRILSPKVVSEATHEVSNNGIYVDGLHDPHDFYVKLGVVTPRPPNPTTLVGTTLHNIPLPSQIKIGENTYEATASTMELVFPLPGTYYVTVRSFPPLDKDFTVVQP
jgi:hypothetical protein